MNDLYIKEADEAKVSKTKIEKLADEKFGNLKGLAQQYLFYWRRENWDIWDSANLSHIFVEVSRKLYYRNRGSLWDYE